MFNLSEDFQLPGSLSQYKRTVGELLEFSDGIILFVVKADSIIF